MPFYSSEKSPVVVQKDKMKGGAGWSPLTLQIIDMSTEEWPNRYVYAVAQQVTKTSFNQPKNTVLYCTLLTVRSIPEVTRAFWSSLVCHPLGAPLRTDKLHTCINT